METAIRTLCEQLNAQVALSEILAENNLETPTRFIRRINNEARWTQEKKPIAQRVTYIREGFPIEFQIRAYERAIALYKS